MSGLFTSGRALGVSRMYDNENAVLVSFDRRLSDDELRALHDHLNASASEPLVKAVARILDENSAWIARPNHEVTRRVAFAAAAAACCGGTSALPVRTEGDQPQAPRE